MLTSLVGHPAVELVGGKLEHGVRGIAPDSPGVIHVVVLSREPNLFEAGLEPVAGQGAHDGQSVGLLEEDDLVRKRRFAHPQPPLLGGSGARASWRDCATRRPALSQTSQSSSKKPPA